MSTNSSEKARKILEHLESMHKEGRGVNGALGRLKRKEYSALQAQLANIIDGLPAKPEPETESKVQPVAKPGPQPTEDRPLEGTPKATETPKAGEKKKTA